MIVCYQYMKNRAIFIICIHQWECYIQDYIDRNSYVVDKKLSLLCFNLLDLEINIPNDIE